MKNKRIYMLFLFCILILASAFFSCGNPLNSGIYTVKYEITGPQVFADLVVYTNESKNLDQITNVPIPWTKTITIQGRVSVSCTAVFDNKNNLTYTAKIFVNGKEIASANSSSIEVSVRGSTQ